MGYYNDHPVETQPLTKEEQQEIDLLLGSITDDDPKELQYLQQLYKADSGSEEQLAQCF